MIELTEQQVQALDQPETAPPRVRNPRTKETFVLLRLDEYEASPWTREELEALAWEAGKGIGWEEMDEYDRLPEKS